MKKQLSVAAVAMLVATPALAGMATFSPATITVPSGTPSVSFDINVESTGAGFDSGDFIVGFSAAGTPNLVSWEYSPAWDPSLPPGTGAMASNVQTPQLGTGMFTYGDFVFVGGASGGPSFAALDLGTITIDTSGLADGTYIVQIDSSADGNFSKLGLGGAAEPISGFATLIIPEPASLALLGLGAAVGLRRRRG